MKMSRKDGVLIVTVLVLSAIIYFVVRISNTEDSGSVRITVDGVEQGRYSLEEERTVPINGGSNVIVISKGRVRMTDADCPDQICVHHKPISKNGESIICLPNKVVVEIQSSEDSTFDAITD